VSSKGSPRALFICGSLNQTTQLHAVARELREMEAWFSPYYVDPAMDVARRIGLLEGTIAGRKLAGRCRDYLRAHGLRVDERGRRGGYDLVVTCSDVVIPSNVRQTPLVAVQEGILDPDGLGWELVRRFPQRLPRWLAGTAATGLSGSYEKFCVASEGYRELFVSRGAPASRVVVTGIPNFDDCEKFRDNDFPDHGYVLICTSDTRETFKLESRTRFLAWARAIAGARRTLVKLHPNEQVERATREIHRFFPDARVFSSGPTEAMIANSVALITQFSSTVFVGLALGKEVHSYYPLESLRRLTPLQNRCAARNISDVCRHVVFGANARRRSVAPAAVGGVH
jgi:hypothetical protein